MNQLPYMTYTVPDEAWDPDELGNHRVVIRVDGRANAVRATVPWRRRDSAPENKGILLYSDTGIRITHYLTINVTNAFGEFLFEPSEDSRVFYLYFMPYTGTVRKPYPQIEYLPPDQEDSPWRQAIRVRLSERFEDAQPIALESVDEFNKFTEMELIADDGELTAFLSDRADRRFLVVLESRLHPIRMTDRIPYRWTLRAALGELSEEALLGEYFVFQIGIYASEQRLDDVTIRFEPLSAESGSFSVAADRFTCFNTVGVGWSGTAFSKTVSVESGRVQPLWCGVDLPLDMPSGLYQTKITVRAEGVEKQIDLRLTIIDRVIVNHGDDDPWRLSKLRWLNSTEGTEDTVFPPYVPVKVDGRKLSMLGRDVVLDDTGLPSQIYSRFTDDLSDVTGEPKALLAGPVRFKVLSSATGECKLTANSFRMGSAGAGFASWTAESSSDELTIAVSGKLEFDGNIEYAVEISAEKDVQLSDISLEIPFEGNTARYMTGLGRKGGGVPDRFSWEWDIAHNQDAVWIGNAGGGIQITLKDENYSRPLNTNFYHLKPLVLPNSWRNNGKGGITLGRTDDAYLVSCFSGERTMRRGESLHFNLRILITPFKPLDTKRHFTSRYCHAFLPVEEVAAMGANTINIHHASAINPYINYPFLESELLRTYVDKAHAQARRVKLYYTVREITTRAPELFALQSLGGEIIVEGAGGGHAWLQEHVRENYIAAWYALAVRDTSVINGALSRWHNFYVAGLDWLAANIHIDGVYIDDLGFGREIMQRVRRVLHRHREEPVIDLHSANQYNEKDGFAGSANLYLEHFPYLDRLWFGEYFNYDEKPDYWLVEVSGILFGLMGEMLQDGGNPWRGMVFGMTARMPRITVNTALWQMWDTYGLPEARMTGFWSDACPVCTDSDDVPATVYAGKRYTIVAVASWAQDETAVNLRIDWEKLGYDEAKVFVPGIAEFQDAEGALDAETALNAIAVRVSPGKGKLVVIENLA